MRGQRVAVLPSLTITLHTREGARMKLKVKVTGNSFLFGQQKPTFIGPHPDCDRAQAAGPATEPGCHPSPTG